MAKRSAPTTNGQRPPLVVDINPSTLTLDEIGVFEPGGFTVSAFKSFMAKYSNWTPVQVGSLTLAELRAVSGDIGRAVAAASVPKVTGAS